jgi:hypothetical protein
MIDLAPDKQWLRWVCLDFYNLNYHESANLFNCQTSLMGWCRAPNLVPMREQDYKVICASHVSSGRLLLLKYECHLCLNQNRTKLP